MAPAEEHDLAHYLTDKCAEVLELGCALARMRDDLLALSGRLSRPPPSVHAAQISELVIARKSLEIEKEKLQQEVKTLSEHNNSLQTREKDLMLELDELKTSSSNLETSHEEEIRTLKAAHARELQDLKANLGQEKAEYFRKFLGSNAFKWAATHSVDGLFRKSVYKFYQCFEDAYPVLPEYVGVRDIPDEELAFPHDLLKSCRWDENLDRLVDPAGNILQKTLKARSFTPVGFKYPFPSDR
jgi:hypothetical protein